MGSPTSADDLIGRRRIVVADEDPKVVDFIIKTLREHDFAVFHAYDHLSAIDLVLSISKVHLLITNTRVGGLPGIELIYTLRTKLPNLPILYIANMDRSTPALEAKLPRDVQVLREPFDADDLRAVVGALLARGAGLALDVEG